MKSAQAWFSEYGSSHKNPINKAIHWLCVPAIYWTVVALLFSSPFPAGQGGSALWLNWASIALVPALLFYFRLSFGIGFGMLIFSGACLFLSAWLQHYSPWPLWALALGVFALAWILQFIGHAIEGKKPSFFQDLQFLLIGPAWLLGFILHKTGIGYRR